MIHKNIHEKHNHFRLDQAATIAFEDFSRSQIKRWIEQGNLLVNGESLKPKDKVHTGDELSLEPVFENKVSWDGENIPINIIEESEKSHYKLFSGYIKQDTSYHKNSDNSELGKVILADVDQFIIFVLRDLLILLGAAFEMSITEKTPSPNLIGKITTTFQIIYILVLIIFEISNVNINVQIFHILIGFISLLSLLS